MNGPDAYRLTAEDERRVTAAAREFYAPLRSLTDPADRLAAERVARHAIGCNVHDLTDAENQWIAEQVSRTVCTLNNERAARARWTAAGIAANEVTR